MAAQPNRAEPLPLLAASPRWQVPAECRLHNESGSRRFLSLARVPPSPPLLLSPLLPLPLPLPLLPSPSYCSAVCSHRAANAKGSKGGHDFFFFSFFFVRSAMLHTASANVSLVFQATIEDLESNN